MYLGRNRSWVPLVKLQNAENGKTFSLRNVYSSQVVFLPTRELPWKKGVCPSSHWFLQSLSKWALKRYENRDVSRVLLLPQWFKPTKLRRFCIEDWQQSDVSYTCILLSVRAYCSSSTGYFHFLNRPSSESRRRLNFLLCKAWREAVRVTNKATN